MNWYSEGVDGGGQKDGSPGRDQRRGSSWAWCLLEDLPPAWPATACAYAGGLWPRCRGSPHQIDPCTGSGSGGANFLRSSLHGAAFQTRD